MTDKDVNIVVQIALANQIAITAIIVAIKHTDPDLARKIAESISEMRKDVGNEIGSPVIEGYLAMLKHGAGPELTLVED